MKLLINKAADGATEIQSLTGSYYANNDFTRIRTDWTLAQEEILKIVGHAVMQRAIDHYYTDAFTTEPSEGSGSGESDIDSQLVLHLQVPIAYLATNRYYQSNLVGHDDAGRKVKIDNQNEKLPWEWMLDRDDEEQARKAAETTDRLLRFLDDEQISEWIQSPQRALVRQLLVNTTALFHAAYPIDMSHRFFYTTLPFSHEVQTRTIRKALGSYYDPLMAYWQNYQQSDGSGSDGGGLPGITDTDELFDQLIPLLQSVIPLFVMIMAAKRFSISLLPYSVVHSFKSMYQTKNAQQPAMKDILYMWIKSLTDDADYILDDIKRILNAADPDALNYPLVPTSNNPCNKYFRT